MVPVHLLLAAHYLRRAGQQLAHPASPPPVRLADGPLFESGAVWMGRHLAVLRGQPLPAVVPLRRFTYYGWLKYGMSLAGLALAAMVLKQLSYWLLPLAGLGFYLVEIQFVFLFPMLLEGSPQPLRASCRLTARVGVWRCLSVVLPVAAFMLVGLVRPGRSLHHWYVGCLAILLWYVDEVPAA